MKRRLLNFLGLAFLLTTFAPGAALGQRRRVVVKRPGAAVVRRPVRHTRVVVRPGHPLRRALPDRVVVRPARKTVVVGATPVFLPVVTWAAAAAVSPPTRERLVWEDAEVITRDEGWVDTNFGVDGRGGALYLRVEGSARLNFAEVAFADDSVQVLDMGDRTRGEGVYRLLDFADGRHVKTVRLLAKSNREETKLSIYLGR